MSRIEEREDCSTDAEGARAGKEDEGERRDGVGLSEHRRRRSIQHAAECAHAALEPRREGSTTLGPPLSPPPEAFNPSIMGPEEAFGQVRLVSRCLPPRCRNDVIRDSRSFSRQLSIDRARLPHPSRICSHGLWLFSTRVSMEWTERDEPPPSGAHL
ncbi:hypothetical protein PENTCL1PPCAC_9281 [Pristionchus entomophagus]|uniref:Uncharacterized protein n=1 Tax=Pristionchus entomophagus TaxID=358040 RepID=A0AAV5SV99_9BILA|nr:hypothetical protein PENTCL1PPCAC_9281 [Pristionchus entomophagus]